MEEKTREALLREFRERTNTLMAAAQLLGGLVEREGRDKDKECLAVMNKNLYCILRDIEHLEWSGEEREHRPAAVDLAELCEFLGEQMDSLAPVLGLSFSCEVGRGPIITAGDREQLLGAILNLLSNAITAAGEGGEVRLTCAFIKGEEGRCHISVEDRPADGAGPVETPANPFLKRRGGVGLGLEVVQRAAALHGGVFVTQYGQDGTTAMLSLPLRPAEDTGFRDRDLTGGFSTVVMELAPLLPASFFTRENLE